MFGPRWGEQGRVRFWVATVVAGTVVPKCSQDTERGPTTTWCVPRGAGGSGRREVGALGRGGAQRCALWCGEGGHSLVVLSEPWWPTSTASPARTWCWATPAQCEGESESVLACRECHTAVRWRRSYARTHIHTPPHAPGEPEHSTPAHREGECE